MRRASTVRAHSSLAASAHTTSDLFALDQRWQLAQRIVASSGFARSPLLSRFLLHVVHETLAGRAAAISEHQIGVHVFGRPRGYRTEDDNIVRNYARQLRRRLAEYFSANGPDEAMSILMPVGGYVPHFEDCSHLASLPPQLIRSNPPRDYANQLASPEYPSPQAPAATLVQPVHGSALDSELSPATLNLMPGSPTLPDLAKILLARIPRLSLRIVLPLLTYSLVLVFLASLISWRIARRTTPHHPPVSAVAPAHRLWVRLFNRAQNTCIIPPDAGFNLVEDISSSTIPLADYMQGAYLNASLRQLDPQSARDLRTQQFTDFISARILADLERLPEFSRQLTTIRFPRDVRLDELSNDNVILIGSMLSNPWSSLANPDGNFRIVPRPAMRGADIVDRAPAPGEAARYSSHWDQPAHDTYAILALTPNLSGKGYFLLIEGLDAAGTQAAAEFLFSPSVEPILDRAIRTDGSILPFEILLRATSLQSHANGTTVIATRFHPSSGNSASAPGR